MAAVVSFPTGDVVASPPAKYMTTDTDGMGACASFLTILPGESYILAIFMAP